MSSAVSIIFPTFNRLEFLRPAIESVFPRSFEDRASQSELHLIDEPLICVRSLIGRAHARSVPYLASLHAATGRPAVSAESRTHPGFR